MAALIPKNLGLDEDSHETAELRRFLGSEPWTVAQLTEALASSNCLGLTDPAPSSPANLLSGFIADLKYPGYHDFGNSKQNMMLHLDGLILQIRLRFRMAPPQSLENAIGDIDFLLSLVQELGSKILYEWKAHAEAIARVKQDLEVTARKRPIFTGGESTVSSPVGSRVSTVAAGVDDQISAIRRTQEERRARLSSAIAQLKNEVQGVKDREQQLSEENELLIRSTAQQEQALEEYPVLRVSLSQGTCWVVQPTLSTSEEAAIQNKLPWCLGSEQSIGKSEGDEILHKAKDRGWHA
jgi:hypothetical protein